MNPYPETTLIRRALMGAIIGDAIGVPYEFLPRAEAPRQAVMKGYGTHFQPPGTWSDDSSLLIASAHAIAENAGRVNYNAMAREFVAWLTRGKWTPHGKVFDVGIQTGSAIRKLPKLNNPCLAGSKAREKQGNGSLMRILPVAIAVRRKPRDERWSIIRNASGLTHGSENCKTCCIIFSEMIRHLIAGQSLQYSYLSAIIDCDDLIKASEDLYRFSYDLPNRGIQDVQGSGWVVHCLEAAIWSCYKGRTYEGVIQAAISLGEDTDTTACVAGALAGILRPAEEIPLEWRKGLVMEEGIGQLADRFADATTPAVDPRKPLFEIPTP